MESMLVNALLLPPLLYTINNVWCLLLNVRAARTSGIPYVVVPWYAYNSMLMILTRPLHKILDKLFPDPPPTSWRRLVGSGWLWKMRHQPFVDLGTDTFLVVSPGGIIMYTADANVISQVTARDKEFPKAIKLYKNVDIYGKNILSSDGAAWRKHRKLTASSFSERNNQLVWKETLKQTERMLTSWRGTVGAEGGRTVRSVGGDTMHLSLTVISQAGLGREMNWLASTEGSDASNTQQLPKGHSMTFTYSLQYVLSHIIYIMAIPKWLLMIWPSSAMKKSYQAYNEWGRYMHEMVAAKRSAVKQQTCDERENMDLIGQLIKVQETSAEGGNSRPETILSESEIIGNMFVFIIAGHETAANSIHFTLLLLALHPEMQEHVQDDLQRILHGRKPEEWEYEHDFPLLSGCMLGATLREQLRLITPVLSIPKIVGSTPQQLTINDRRVMVPANTMVRLCVHAAHRNPKFWPHRSPKDASKSTFPPGNVDNDLEEFKPERWLCMNGSPPATSDDSNDMTKMTQEHTSSLYTPVRGAYLPFSDGQRACSGKRFAQVEVLAALALILTQCSVELAVDQWATDEEVESMTRVQRKAVWQKAEKSATWIWQQKMQCLITLQIRGANIPMRFVKKGSERFRGI